MPGITSKLQYIVETGINAIWLSPIYPSPMIDSGYDISDFVDVDSSFGTLKDFQALLARAKELGLKVRRLANIAHIDKFIDKFLMSRLYISKLKMYKLIFV